MYPDRRPLVHLCLPPQWDAAQATGTLEPPSLQDAGFIHLSAPEQAHLPANRLFTGRTDLLVLYVDPGRLSGPLRWEPGLPGDPPTMLFPHLYGPLPVAAVIEVSRYLPGAEGRFAPLIHSPDR